MILENICKEAEKSNREGINRGKEREIEGESGR